MQLAGPETASNRPPPPGAAICLALSETLAIAVYDSASKRPPAPSCSDIRLRMPRLDVTGEVVGGWPCNPTLLLPPECVGSCPEGDGTVTPLAPE